MNQLPHPKLKLNEGDFHCLPKKNIIDTNSDIQNLAFRTERNGLHGVSIFVFNTNLGLVLTLKLVYMIVLI